MAEPEPQLLSLLEKVAHPLQQLTLKVKFHGIYAPPQQWKLTDQANPNLFGYSLRILREEFKGGKIQPRKLTEKQQRELEQKAKKGGKKQTKQQQKPAQIIDHAQQQRKQREWNALSEQEKFYRTQEDPYKAFSLQFPQKQKDIQFTSQNIEQLQSKVNNDSIEIELIRKPEMNEEELGKLKKSKPKNLNLAELYPMVYKGVMKTKQLETPGATHISQRVKFSFAGEVPSDGIKIQSENCYIFIELECSQPITPQVKQIKPSTQQILPQFPPASQRCNPVFKLKAQIRRSIRAISQQYVTCFTKQKEHQQQHRHLNLNSISTLKLNQINKRKQLFLNQFVNSGKFSLLKDRISKSIKSVIIDKFRKQRQSSSITTEQINMTLSQLNLYFQEEFIKTIDQFMTNQSNTIHEDLVLGYENSRQYRKTAIAPIVNESQIQRETRLAGEYEILEKDYDQNREYRAQQHYINVLLLSNESLQSKQNYAKFCLKGHKFNQAYVLYNEIAQQSQKLQHKLIKAILLVNRRRTQQVTELLTQMMEDPDCQIVNKINYNLLLSFMYERQNDIKSSEKYLAIAERYYKMKNNPYLKFIPLENPYQLPKPKVPKPERYASQLTHAESQQIRSHFITILADLNLYNLVSEYLPKLEESTKKSIYQIQVDVFNKKYDDALAKIETLLEKGDNIKNVDYLLIKADICYRSDRMFECEEIFLHILQLKPATSKAIHVYLRLGYTYLSRKSWQDAKQVFEKAVEQKYNCSVAWLGLGISNLNLGKYQQAEQALNLSKIYNPLSDETTEYQQKINQNQRQKYQSLTNRSKTQSIYT